MEEKVLPNNLQDMRNRLDGFHQALDTIKDKINQMKENANAVVNSGSTDIPYDDKLEDVLKRLYEEYDKLTNDYLGTDPKEFGVFAFIGDLNKLKTDLTSLGECEELRVQYKDAMEHINELIAELSSNAMPQQEDNNQGLSENSESYGMSAPSNAKVRTLANPYLPKTGIINKAA